MKSKNWRIWGCAAMKSNSIPTRTYSLSSGETLTIYSSYAWYLFEYPRVIQRCDRRGNIYYEGITGVRGDADEK